MLATLRRPPPRGSVQSYVLQALLIRRDHIEYVRTRALVQAIINKDEANNALELYRDAQMPYLPKVKMADRQQTIQKLMSEVARGPMEIKPVMQKSVKSRLKTKVIQRNEEERLASSRRISNKIGGLL